MSAPELNRADFIPLQSDLADAIAQQEKARLRAMDIADRLSPSPPPSAFWLANQAAMLSKHAADTLRLAGRIATDRETEPTKPIAANERERRIYSRGFRDGQQQAPARPCPHCAGHSGDEDHRSEKFPPPDDTMSSKA